MQNIFFIVFAAAVTLLTSYLAFCILAWTFRVLRRGYKKLRSLVGYVSDNKTIKNMISSIRGVSRVSLFLFIVLIVLWISLETRTLTGVSFVRVKENYLLIVDEDFQRSEIYGVGNETLMKNIIIQKPSPELRRAFKSLFNVTEIDRYFSAGKHELEVPYRALLVEYFSMPCNPVGYVNTIIFSAEKCYFQGVDHEVIVIHSKNSIEFASCGRHLFTFYCVGPKNLTIQGGKDDFNVVMSSVPQDYF